MSSRSGLSVLAAQKGPLMRCPACGFENASGIRFCGECGAPLGLTCTSCGFENAPGSSDED
jgi:hypothetical protein